ncbi:MULTISPECIES: transcription initiation factor TFIIIB [Anaerotignum]|uniref:transcription initiation factor TFIIIB n=1 Tax=Anaerotignum TaxID=2039240 RepID=UPI00210EF950|nr:MULTISPECIES: transcription initiation factor TFIIIB [Anaerotignum]MCQ4935184.1 transcription initiation factor TFIIIB [Anaerotignum propionicum]
MKNNKECPICGCNEIGEGLFSGYATMKPTNKFFALGSNVIADVCTKCGHILSFRVAEPEKFK